MLNNKIKIRLLPILIFVAVLSLSIKINSVYDLYRQTENKKLSISASQAKAEEKLNKETFQLTDILKKGDPDSETPKNISTAFSNSEIFHIKGLCRTSRGQSQAESPFYIDI